MGEGRGAYPGMGEGPLVLNNLVLFLNQMQQIINLVKMSQIKRQGK